MKTERAADNIRKIVQGGKVSFQVRYKPRGKPGINLVFDDLKTAKQELANFIASGQRPVPRQITICQAIEDYRTNLKFLDQYTDFENTKNLSVNNVYV